MRRRTVVALVVGVVVVAVWMSCAVIAAKPAKRAPKKPVSHGPSIQFTLVPVSGGGPDSKGNIAGKVVNCANPQNYRIVLYAQTDMWYVQPLTDKPFTKIGKDGKWKSGTHLGVTYAALLVQPSFTPKDKTDALPKVGGSVLAVATTPAKK